MRNGKYAARRSSGTKVVTLLLAVLVLVGCSVGATMAWLVKSTNEVVNTFTVGNIKIDLNEHTYVPATNKLTTTTTKTNSNYKLIPGKNMPKDPFVTVKAGSEKCWLFVAVTEENNAFGQSGEAVIFDVNEGNGTGLWNGVPELSSDGYTNKENVSVYYTIVDSNATENQNINVLKNVKGCNTTGHSDGCVTVASEIDNTWTAAPKLTFNAAAIQYDGLEITGTGDEAELNAAINAFRNLPEDFIEICCNKVTPAPTPET